MLRIARTLNRPLKRVSLWMPSNENDPISANFGVFWDGREMGGDPSVQREAITYRDRDDA